MSGISITPGHSTCVPARWECCHWIGVPSWASVLEVGSILVSTFPVRRSWSWWVLTTLKPLSGLRRRPWRWLLWRGNESFCSLLLMSAFIAWWSTSSPPTWEGSDYHSSPNPWDVSGLVSTPWVWLGALTYGFYLRGPCRFSHRETSSFHGF